jgi:PAS domain S-box-containing protein
MPSLPENSSTRLRSQAEERLQGRLTDAAGMTPEEIQSALHELSVHQVELEMQSEQLRATQVELEKAREQYVGLYDFAPVGYLTLSEQGLILTANLTSVNMLGVERSRLVTLPFSRFVFREDQDSFYLCLRNTFDTSLAQSCEVRLGRAGGGAVFWGRLELLQVTEGGAPVCHVTLSDVTEHRRAEEAVREHERPQLQYENEERMRLALEAGELGTWGNPALLTQCFSNLLANGLKFVQPGKAPQVRIWAREIPGGRADGSPGKDAPVPCSHRVRIWFEDNGIGIPAEYRDKIFEMFQRLSPDFEGTGIGLALVKKAMHRMGGSVGFESEPGRGSRFWLEFNKAGA